MAQTLKYRINSITS